MALLSAESQFSIMVIAVFISATHDVMNIAWAMIESIAVEIPEGAL
jgi:hypothetical protein